MRKRNINLAFQNSIPNSCHSFGTVTSFRLVWLAFSHSWVI